ncbi:MAG: M24 family metallopeptidase C-terminal domain-containing protein [Hominisplanchenecus sp.]|uniref:M24 family metallopeptidase C-terminal domain-containing protein n=1 Tax=Hominisplanchenecus sp. TaxID=3038130 RepID=UPI00399A617B
MCFEHLTMVPFDLDAVVPELMTVQERALLNNYHAQVYKRFLHIWKKRKKNG